MQGFSLEGKRKEGGEKRNLISNAMEALEAKFLRI